MLQHDIVSGMVIKENIHFAEPVLKVISQINVVEPDVLQIVVKLTVINEPLKPCTLFLLCKNTTLDGVVPPAQICS